MTDLRDELEAWCQSYVTAFSAYDAPAISSHWTFPSVIAQSGRSISFKSAEHFDQNTSSLLGFYKSQDVDNAVRTVVDFLPMNDETVAMTVAGKWRAVMALADGEVSAWANRGTPLGKAPK